MADGKSQIGITRSTLDSGQRVAWRGSADDSCSELTSDAGPYVPAPLDPRTAWPRRQGLALDPNDAEAHAQFGEALASQIGWPRPRQSSTSARAEPGLRRPRRLVRDLVSELRRDRARRKSGRAGFLRSLALPQEDERWSLTTLRERLVRLGARIVRNQRYLVFRLAQLAATVTVPRSAASD